jgi:two-component system sensor histidine kinase SenX3
LTPGKPQGELDVNSPASSFWFVRRIGAGSIVGAVIGLIYALLLALLAAVFVLASMLHRDRAVGRRVVEALGVAGASLDLAPDRIGHLRRDVETADRDLARLDAAAEAAPFGLVIVDPGGDRMFTNATAAAYASGGPGDAVVGLRLRTLIADAVKSDEPIQQEIELYAPTTRRIQLRAVPLSRDGGRLGTVIFIEDLTARSHVDSMRRDFVANASHELKTPLGALRLLAEALGATDDDATRHRLSERLQNEAVRMTRLVEDILELALIEENRRVQGVVDLCEVVTDAVGQVALLSETLGIPVESHCEPATVLGDRRRLVSAVANLIENALTYTRAKGLDQPPPVEVRVYPAVPDAVVEVEDRGIGIPERHRNRIFERFYRIDRGRSRSSGGTGLGLAIVRHVVENHGGTIEVESVPGEGSTFRILLPARET